MYKFISENKIFTTASFANIVFTRNVQQCMTEAGHSHSVQAAEEPSQRQFIGQSN
ncbi:hypothetical protein DPMN_068199 [Dreissena polymorpha]|uniref:Uncharacterized protein n=1 Tax=Dreissena polymorpha TaxID=45954 RepID=A0A9D4BTE5_DREPO|nr:hypothetical protein DPMN_068199 [Dreissena polymorpha]